MLRPAPFRASFSRSIEVQSADVRLKMFIFCIQIIVRTKIIVEKIKYETICIALLRIVRQTNLVKRSIILPANIVRYSLQK